MTTDEFARGFIVGLAHSGKSVRQIVAIPIHGVTSKTTVQRIIAEHRKKTAKRPKKKTASSTQKRIADRRRHAVHLATKVTRLGDRRFPTCGTSKRISVALASQRGIVVSPRTIRRDMKALGFRSIVRPKVSGMTEKNKKDRFNFCWTFTRRYGRAYVDWPVGTDPKTRIVFSDEHYITTNDSTCRYQYAQSSHDVLPRESKHRFNTKCLMIWAAVGYNYKSKIVIINTNLKDEDGATMRLDKDRYRRVCLIGSGVIRDCAARGLIFMQDGARCHIASQCLAYIASKGCAYINNWPPHSPELNPIEKLWAHLNEVVSTHYAPATSVDELGRQVTEAWERHISQETINRFVLGFAGSLETCRKKQGLP